MTNIALQFIEHLQYIATLRRLRRVLEQQLQGPISDLPEMEKNILVELNKIKQNSVDIGGVRLRNLDSGRCGVNVVIKLKRSVDFITLDFVAGNVDE